MSQSARILSAVGTAGFHAFRKKIREVGADFVERICEVNWKRELHLRQRFLEKSSQAGCALVAYADERITLWILVDTSILRFAGDYSELIADFTIISIVNPLENPFIVSSRTTGSP